MKTANITGILLALTCMMFAMPLQTNAQTVENKTWMRLFIGHQEYDGDYVNEMLQFGVGHDVAGGAGVQQYLSPSFDADLSVTLGRLDDEYAPNHFSMYMINTNLMLNYKLANGYIFKEYSKVQPFIATGAGYSFFVRGTEPDASAFQLPAGAGFDIPISENVGFTYQATYNRTFSDHNVDGSFQGDNSDHDDFLVHTVGLKFRLGAAQDTDQDGIADSKDECPNVIGEAKTNGCPDRDGDLVIDSEDRCPNRAGMAKFNGCPDTDADGIADYEDECPSIAGSREFDGCKDTDSDGIADNTDACPKLAGTEKTDGCPDNDRDGVMNKADNCPDKVGDKVNNGCPPDADSDGVLDASDECPQLAGVKDNNGCPVVTQEMKDTINLIFQ
ncbi:MAG: hypothetical protein FH748_05330 [Balneolaceae bacterium]|nr:hypothetical protein [Balneolaceae bacterium]